MSEGDQVTRGRWRPGRYVVAVVVAWSAGLVLAGRIGPVSLPLAVVLALPLAAVLAIRAWSPPPPSHETGDERSTRDT
jgi:hypothetical protein